LSLRIAFSILSTGTPHSQGGSAAQPQRNEPGVAKQLQWNTTGVPLAPMEFEPTLPPCRRPESMRQAAHERRNPRQSEGSVACSPKRTQLEPDPEVGASNGRASIRHRINRLKTPWTHIWHLEGCRQDSQERYEPFTVGPANSRSHRSPMRPSMTEDSTIGSTHYGTRVHRYLSRDI
jgi:hypothetical protein